jgi:hypothetical protein
MVNSKKLKKQLMIRPVFFKVLLIFVILILMGRIAIDDVSRRGQIVSKINIVLTDEYHLEYDTFTSLPDGRSVNFLNYIWGPGKKLSKKQLKSILKTLEINKPNSEGIIKSVEIIEQNEEMKRELDSWISRYSKTRNNRENPFVGTGEAPSPKELDGVNQEGEE